MIPFAKAVPIALRAIQARRIGFLESCTLCDPDATIGPFGICTGCERESAWGWEVDLMKYFEPGGGALIEHQPDEKLKMLLSR